MYWQPTRPWDAGPACPSSPGHTFPKGTVTTETSSPVHPGGSSLIDVHTQLPLVSVLCGNENMGSAFQKVLCWPNMVLTAPAPPLPWAHPGLRSCLVPPLSACLGTKLAPATAHRLNPGTCCLAHQTWHWPASPLACSTPAGPLSVHPVQADRGLPAGPAVPELVLCAHVQAPSGVQGRFPGGWASSRLHPLWGSL